MAWCGGRTCRPSGFPFLLWSLPPSPGAALRHPRPSYRPELQGVTVLPRRIQRCVDGLDAPVPLDCTVFLPIVPVSVTQDLWCLSGVFYVLKQLELLLFELYSSLPWHFSSGCFFPHKD